MRSNFFYLLFIYSSVVFAQESELTTLIVDRARQTLGNVAYKIEVEVTRKATQPLDETELYSTRRDVYLKGVVRSPQAKEIIEKIATDAADGAVVHNEIQVDPAYGKAPPLDPTLADRVLNRVKEYHPYGAYRLSVTTIDNRLHIEGYVESEFVRSQIIELVKTVPGVGEIDNQLKVQVPDREFGRK